MAIVKAVRSGASLGRASNYVNKPEKCLDRETGEFLSSGIACRPETSIDEMKATKEVWNKEGGAQYRHYVVSFHENENVSPAQAHEMAKELAAEHFKGHECLITTHTTEAHTHSHIIVNSINYENGKRWHEPKEKLQEMKDRHDELCRQNGLTITEKHKDFTKEAAPQQITSNERGKYEVLNSGKSWEVDMAAAVTKAKDSAVSREDFISKMNESGYDVNYRSRSSYITFKVQSGEHAGMKCRNTTLQKDLDGKIGMDLKLSRDDFERAFEVNRSKIQEAEKPVEQIKPAAAPEQPPTVSIDLHELARQHAAGQKKRLPAEYEADTAKSAAAAHAPHPAKLPEPPRTSENTAITGKTADIAKAPGLPDVSDQREPLNKTPSAPAEIETEGKGEVTHEQPEAELDLDEFDFSEFTKQLERSGVPAEAERITGDYEVAEYEDSGIRAKDYSADIADSELAIGKADNAIKDSKVRVGAADKRVEQREAAAAKQLAEKQANRISRNNQRDDR